MNHTLRKATESDIPQIVELSGLLADYHFKIDPYWKPGAETKKTFGDFLKDQLVKPNVMWLVAECDSKIVGYFSADISPTKPIVSVPEVGHVAGAFILDEYRGKGIAKKAVQIFLDWFKENNIKVVEIAVDSRNEEGVRAWEGVGFREYMKKMKMDI